MAIAQASKVVRRIGVLDPGTQGPENIRREAEALGKFGWVEGQNLYVERRSANGRSEALQPLAEELVRAKVEIILTGGTAATRAAMHATSTIPIVFCGTGDPVLLGLVASLVRPGGNVTGYSLASPEVSAKSLSLLKELLPGLQRIGVVSPAGSPYNRASRGQFEHVCQSLGLVPVFVEITDAGEIGSAIAQLQRQRAQALMLESVYSWDHEIVDAATKHGLPTMTDGGELARDGALISYSSTQVEGARLCSEYIDRILRGAGPADLPVQQPRKFELAINLKTAKALGLTIPKELLLRADQLIQ
jgi:putative ABC transport system substrate-binding protein